MICASCGKEISADSKFCVHCGGAAEQTPVSSAAPRPKHRRGSFAAILAVVVVVGGIFALVRFLPNAKGISSTGKRKGSEGLYVVTLGGKDGYIESSGKLAITPQFEEASPFSEKLARVKLADKWGYIDRTGKYVIDPQFDEASSFSEGLAAVVVGGKLGYVDKSGKYLINPQFDSENVIAERFIRALEAGLAKPYKPSIADFFAFSDSLASISIGGKIGYIDKLGKIVINPQFDFGFSFEEGLAPVSTGGKFGFIDKSGRYVINSQFDFGFPFFEGFAAVSVGGKFGFIDKSGKYVINPQFDVGTAFNEGLAAVMIGHKFGFINRSGKFVINPQFEEAGSFREGLAPVKISGKCGFIDKSGQYLINPQFDKAYPFDGALAFVEIGEEFGYINRAANYVWDQGFREAAARHVSRAQEFMNQNQFDMALKECDLAAKYDANNQQTFALKQQISKAAAEFRAYQQRELEQASRAEAERAREAEARKPKLNGEGNEICPGAKNLYFSPERGITTVTITMPPDCFGDLITTPEGWRYSVSDKENRGFYILFQGEDSPIWLAPDSNVNFGSRRGIFRLKGQGLVTIDIKR